MLTTHSHGGASPARAPQMATPTPARSSRSGGEHAARPWQVHPTTMGHALLGALAARHVARRLLSQGCAAGGPLHAKGLEPEAAAAPGADASGPAEEGGGGGGHGEIKRRGRALGRAAGHALAPLSSGSPLERCYTSADRLPLLGAAPGHPPTEGGWSLIDEGGAKVSKLGVM